MFDCMKPLKLKSFRVHHRATKFTNIESDDVCLPFIFSTININPGDLLCFINFTYLFGTNYFYKRIQIKFDCIVYVV